MTTQALPHEPPPGVIVPQALPDLRGQRLQFVEHQLWTAELPTLYFYWRIIVTL